jgi:hypothetical protein
MNITIEKFNSIFISQKHHYDLLKKFDLYKYKNKKHIQLILSQELLSNPDTIEFLRNHSQYDLFKILKIKVTENQISDAIAFCLNPKKSAWGKKILLNLVRKYSENTKIINIIEKTPTNKFYVKREWSGELSRIDIRVVTKNGKNLPNTIIDFEMKIGSGEETFSEGEYQTQREWTDLLKLAESQNIPKNQVIAFYVSPLKSKPHSKKFISVQYSEFNRLITKVLLTSKDENYYDYKYALIHFLSSKHIFQE